MLGRLLVSSWHWLVARGCGMSNIGSHRQSLRGTGGHEGAAESEHDTIDDSIVN